MFAVKYRKIFYSISVILIGASIGALLMWGLNLGIDFKGGSLLSVVYAGNKPDVQMVTSSLEELNFGGVSVREAGPNGYIIRTREINQDEKNEILRNLSFGSTYSPQETEFSSVGPVLGAEAVRKSYISIVLVLLAIVLFVTFAFRKVSKPISSWIYGSIAIIALLHDVIIPTGLFSVLGHYYGYEVDTLFVTALLVILGFSVHDTIVVFDRVREHLRNNFDRNSKEDFETTVGKSVSETMVRSINTSLTTLLAIVVLYILGPEATRHFSLALGVGIIVGTYSSVFIGSPLLVTINKIKGKH